LRRLRSFTAFSIGRSLLRRSLFGSAQTVAHDGF
jgi:hypothetical protein